MIDEKILLCAVDNITALAHGHVAEQVKQEAECAMRAVKFPVFPADGYDEEHQAAIVSVDRKLEEIAAGYANTLRSLSNPKENVRAIEIMMHHAKWSAAGNEDRARLGAASAFTDLK